MSITNTAKVNTCHNLKSFIQIAFLFFSLAVDRLQKTNFNVTKAVKYRMTERKTSPQRIHPVREKAKEKAL